MRYLLLILFSILLFTACETVPKQEENAANLKRYDIKGKILSFDKKTKMASVEHDPVEGFMDAMTMDFEIRKPEWAWDEITPGTEITGELVVDNVNGKNWLELTGIVAADSSGKNAPVVRDDVASVGTEIPDFTLTNQDGKEISAKDFRGKALAVTFIYSECPLPEYCILMSKNFSDLANQIADDDELNDKIRLLSISFDPKRDTPEKLKTYGLGYLGKDSKAKDFKVWQLARGEDAKIKNIADFFGLFYKVSDDDQTQFAHSLRTIVISPQGKVVKVYSGGDWKTQDLLEKLKKTLEQN